jgi:hypothetical protein
MGNIRRAKHGPEWHIQRDLIRYLRDRNWHVERMIGNMFQEGIPDIYAFRRDFGSRWIDVKAPGKYSFTKAQKRKWPVWDSVGIGIWILTGATQQPSTTSCSPKPTGATTGRIAGAPQTSTL